ncbi:MAG: DUF4177 domain-containing protein [Tepidiformaceae bacterium]
MPAWEYASLLNSGPATRDELNNLGSEGWELVSVVRADNAASNSPQLLYVFKRQVAPAAS